MYNNNNNNKSLPQDFNWKEYVRLNPDLNPLITETNAILHYLNYGILENRIYKIKTQTIPDDFNWKEYILLNVDLRHIKTEIEAKRHYIHHGIKERRTYKKDNSVEDIVVRRKKYEHVNYYNKLNNYDFLDESELLITKLFFKNNPNYLKYNKNIHILDSIPQFVLVLDFNNGGGGTTFFLNCIVSKYKKYTTFVILRCDEDKYYLNINEEYLLNIKLNTTKSVITVINKYVKKISKIFVNHLLGFNNELIKYIFSLNIYKTYITHDYSNIFSNPQPTFKEITNDNVYPNPNIDMSKFDTIITQNKMNITYFSKYYKKKIDVVGLPDFTLPHQKIETNNSIIKCCIIGNISDIKGKQELEKIMAACKFNSEKIEFFVIGFIKNDNKNISHNFYIYNSINEFNNILKTHKPNVILELTKWPETYSYTLTLSMITELPILYYEKPWNSVVLDRLKSYKKSYEFNNIYDAIKLIKTKKQDYFYTIKPILNYNKYWNDLFINGEKKTLNENYKFKYDIKPYFIYFPQFHEIYENNINFYDKYSDIKNLISYNKSYPNQKKDIPNSSFCDINTYDYILNENLIQKQINIIKEYGFCGFAIYYYWFSKNTYTNKNMIMDKVIDKFFEQSIQLYDKKIFFIWANEDWTHNDALSPEINKEINKESKLIIKNEYNFESFEKNSENLINYFKNDKYLKIDNKPVLFIYHAYLIDNIDEFYNILNNKCINNGFAGINLVLNSFVKIYKNYKNFYINFNYKKSDCRFYDEKYQQTKIDYKNYVNNKNHCKKNNIQTIVFDFDNKARLFKPNQLNKSTVCINNSELCKRVFAKKLIKTYNKSSYKELDKILLVNAFNEWGENMSFEPSDKYKYFNINLLHSLLIS